MALSLDNLHVTSFETAARPAPADQPLAVMASGEDCFTFPSCYPTILNGCITITYAV